ncbi:MAG: hypothetical protein JO061_11665, partial [Acidobacteriaceae bacterium]|nr:hypothetical protein [Acidobacteriaceae bacterium]
MRTMTPDLSAEVDNQHSAASTVAPQNSPDWFPSTVLQGADFATPSIPGRIGRYRILRLLGEGGMGFVYEAEQEQPRRAIALKVLKPGVASPELLRRFEQEARALARLQHPGIA